MSGQRAAGSGHQPSGRLRAQDSGLRTGPARIRAAFAVAKAQERPAFIPYITVGHPEAGTEREVVPALIAAGADIIELGIPFSDPLADGPVIQRSTQIALANGTTLDTCLDAVRDLRAAGVSAPIVFLGYMNPIAQKGEEAFAAACAAVGADGVIVVDLPPEEAGDLRAACDRHGVALIPMLAPTSTERRIEQVAALATGFVYCVGQVGITGARDTLATDLEAFLDRVRAKITVPIAVGFGISRPEHVATVGKLADGVAVGSALVRRLEELPPGERASGAAALVRWLTGSDER
jgi:tryptophan synthase alpha chain